MRALLLAGAQAAETIASLNLAEAGDHLVFRPSLHGGNYNLFHCSLPKLGITVSCVVNPDDPESWRAATRPSTQAFFGESITNPKRDIPDLRAIADVAHAAGGAADHGQHRGHPLPDPVDRVGCRHREAELPAHAREHFGNLPHRRIVTIPGQPIHEPAARPSR